MPDGEWTVRTEIYEDGSRDAGRGIRWIYREGQDEEYRSYNRIYGYLPDISKQIQIITVFIFIN